MKFFHYTALLFKTAAFAIGQSPEIVETWEKPDKVQLKFKSDGLALADAKPFGKLESVKVNKAQLLVRLNGKTLNATVEDCKRNLTLFEVGMPERFIGARIDSGPATSLDVLEERAACEMDGGDVTPKLQCHWLGAKRLREDTVELWATFVEQERMTESARKIFRLSERTDRRTITKGPLWRWKPASRPTMLSM